MKRNSTDVVEQVAAMAPQLNALTVDRVNELAPKAAESELKPLTMKERAKLEGVIYLEPTQRMPPLGKLKPEWEKKRNHDWEYVCGTFMNESMNGYASFEPKEVWHSKWPGDPYCLWVVPVNQKVYLPRMIAKLLSGEKDEDTGMECMKYHKFDYVVLPESKWRVNHQTEQFQPISTQYTGRFIAAGMF